METVKSIGKGFVVFGVVGLLLALSSPLIASAVGMVGGEALGASAAKIAAGAYANALWEGAFFGMFGAIHAAVAPAFDAMFKGKAENKPAVSAPAEKETGRQVNINIQQAPTQSQEQSITEAKFRQTIDAERLAMAIAENHQLGS